MEHSESSNSVANPDETSKLGLQSPALETTPTPSDPNRTAKDDRLRDLHDELKKQLDLEEAEKGAKHSIDSTPSDQDQTAEEHKELHEELREKLNLEVVGEGEQPPEAAAEKRSNDHQSEEELKSGVEENGSESEKEENDDEKKSESFNGIRRHQYPLRPNAEHCAYYMKTGTCKFGSNCKFNHPLRRKNQLAKEQEKEREESAEAPGQTECKYYLRTGGCKYGKACRYNHSKAKSLDLPVLELNFLGLPIRLGEKECPYYMRNGSCKYGSSCRFNHPDPTAAGRSDPPAFVNGGSTSLKSPSQSSIGSWSSTRGLNETASFVPIIFPPAQGVPSHSTEWNGYQGPLYPPERSIHPPPAYAISNPTSDISVYAHQQHQMLVDEFPERPGQPECSFYMKTGDCKFKSNCKYHHPKNRLSMSSPCALSDKGLPLRPDQAICSYYSRYGICKFGPACKFDHPVQLPLPAGSSDNRPSHFGHSATQEESRVAKTGNGNDNPVHQPA